MSVGGDRGDDGRRGGRGPDRGTGRRDAVVSRLPIGAEPERAADAIESVRMRGVLRADKAIKDAEGGLIDLTN